MEFEYTVLILAIGFVVGTILVLVSFYFGYKRGDKNSKGDSNTENKTLLTRLEDKKDQLQQQTENLKKADEQIQEFIVKIQGFIAEKASLETSQKEKSERIQEYKNENEQLRKNLDQTNERISHLETEKREQQIRLKAEEEKILGMKEQFEKQKEELKKEFKIVSEEIVQKHQGALNEENQKNVGALLHPLQQQINDFKKRVNVIHDETIKGNTSLEKEIERIMELGSKMSNETSQLTSALKGDSQKRGAWGEAQLERSLQNSGLVQEIHYEMQSSFKDELGIKKRPDCLVKLPDGKHIIIDSKVSLVAYDKMISANTDSQREQAMKEHVKSIRRHIDDLASKEYEKLDGIQSPDFVLAFMPMEPAYIEALKYDRNLFEYGYEKNIMLLSHTTLIPILRTVSNFWKLAQGNKEAREISKKAGDIYNSVCSLAERFKKLGETLNKASSDYDGVRKALVGKQGLHGKVERFTKISNKANKEMPSLKPRHTSFETSPLEKVPPPNKNNTPDEKTNNVIGIENK